MGETKRPKVYYKGEERRQFFYGILLKHSPFRETDLSRPTRRRRRRRYCCLVWPFHDMQGRKKKREIWQSHRPMQKSIREIGGGGWVGGWRGGCVDGPTSDFFLIRIVVTDRGASTHPTTHNLHLLLKNAKWPKCVWNF